MFVNCEDTFSDQITLESLGKYFNNINDKKLILIFSLPKCKPCKDLQNAIEEIFENIQNDDEAIKNVPNIIKINALNIVEDDKKNIEKYPTMFTINLNGDEKEKLIKTDPIMDFILKTQQKGTIGMPPYSFYQQNNLIIDF
jgi:hypothetical protein